MDGGIRAGVKRADKIIKWNPSLLFEQTDRLQEVIVCIIKIKPIKYHESTKNYSELTENFHII